MKKNPLLLMLVTVFIPLMSAQAQEPVEQLVPEVLEVIPHDSEAFTQGIIFHEGFLYESTGQYGASSLRQVDPETGEVLLYLPLPESVFAEGLALVDDRLLQITWREQVALEFNLSAFTEDEELALGTYEYTGEGWGLCYDGEHIYMSDGTDTLALRDPETFDIVDTVQVTYDDVPLSQLILDEGEIVPMPELATPDANATPAVSVVRSQRIDLLNELECVGDSIYSNVWQTDTILIIDKTTGAVTAQINAAGLLEADDLAGADVLNGIVYLPDSDTFLITGKYWPKMFEVVFVPEEE